MKNQYSHLNNKILTLANNPRLVETLKKFSADYDWKKIKYDMSAKSIPIEFWNLFSCEKITNSGLISSFVFIDLNSVNFQFSYDIAFWLNHSNTSDQFHIEYDELSTIISIAQKDNLLAFL